MDSKVTWVGSRSIEKSMFWSRLMLVGFYTVFLIAIIWSVPWVPFGLSEADYSTRVTAAVLILFSSWFFALVAFTLRRRARQRRESMKNAFTVHERITEMRRREFFFNRLVIECEKARQSHSRFGIIVFRLDWEEPTTERLNKAVASLRELVDEEELAGGMGAFEVAVLLTKPRDRGLSSTAERFRSILEAALSEEAIGVAAGWAVFGFDGAEAGDLISGARGRIQAEAAAA
jgi:GGDEF domain-containing protein